MSGKVKKRIGTFLFYLFVIAFVALLLLPFIWQFLTSVKPLKEIAEMPARWIPSRIQFDFYVNVFTKHPFARYMLNSFVVAICATLLSIAIGASAAYALSRLRFRGRKALLMGSAFLCYHEKESPMELHSCNWKYPMSSSGSLPSSKRG